MTEPIVQVDPTDAEGDEESALTWILPLEDLARSEDDTFRTQNVSTTDFERRNVIERTRGNVHTRVDLLDVTHGLLDDGDEGTLMVFRFRFDPQKLSSRVLRAVVNIEFLASSQGDDPPTVEAIAPDGRFTVLPTTDQVSTTRGGELTLGASGASVVTASAAARLEQTRTRQVQDATVVAGSINLGSGRNRGDPTAAAWNLLENKHRKSGVPDSVKVAILLRRTDGEPFKAVVTLEADCDFVTGLQSKFRKLPIDDPVLFNPRLAGKKPKKGRSYGTEVLSNIKLDDLCEVRMAIEAPLASSEGCKD